MDFAPIQLRRHLILAAWKLLAVWPDSFVESCRRYHIRGSDILGDDRLLPHWLQRTLQQHINHMHYSPTVIELRSAIQYLDSRGIKATPDIDLSSSWPGCAKRQGCISPGAGNDLQEWNEPRVTRVSLVVRLPAGTWSSFCTRYSFPSSPCHTALVVSPRPLTATQVHQCEDAHNSHACVGRQWQSALNVSQNQGCKKLLIIFQLGYQHSSHKLGKVAQPRKSCKRRIALIAGEFSYDTFPS